MPPQGSVLVFKAFQEFLSRVQVALCWGSPVAPLCSPSEQHTERGVQSPWL